MRKFMEPADRHASMVFLLAVQPARKCWQLGEAATRFGILLPPSSVDGRWSTLIITALQDATLVDIVDDAADGDSDDTVVGEDLQWAPGNRISSRLMRAG